MENTDAPPEQPFGPTARPPAARTGAHAGHKNKNQTRRLQAPGLPVSSYSSHPSSSETTSFFPLQHGEEPHPDVPDMLKGDKVNNRHIDEASSALQPPRSRSTSQATPDSPSHHSPSTGGAADHISHPDSENGSAARAVSVGGDSRSKREIYDGGYASRPPQQSPRPQPLPMNKTRDTPALPPAMAGGEGATSPDGPSNQTITLSKTTLVVVAAIALLFVLGLLVGLIVAVVESGDGDVVFVTSSPSLKGTLAPTPSPVIAPTAAPVNAATAPPTTPIATAGAIPTAIPTLEPISPTLSRIMRRGSLVCAVSNQDGYNVVDPGTGDRVGFEIDLARAVSAGIFGSEVPVTFMDIPFSERFTTLNSSDVDMAIASVTSTMERDLSEPTTGSGFTFSTPYLYNGLSFAGIPDFVDCADQLNITETCSELHVCVLQGTTHLDRVIQLLPTISIFRAPSVESLYEAFIDGFCNALAGEQFEVSEAAVRAAGYTGEYLVGTTVFSKEPLAIATRDGDPHFSDFVNWILQGLLAAEEQGITQATASSFTKSDVFGADFANMFVDAIAAVGNYGEIYARHLEAMVPRKTINTINGGDSGLIFSFPFGNLDGTGPEPVVGGTLKEIIDRGYLRCGVARRPSFAEFNSTTQTWSGLDVDYCRALSAAIFSGVSNTVVYRDLPATQRFNALANGDVDVLSRITTVTITRDVFEPVAKAGFSFAQPNFYDGLSFGGIPPYSQCAENLDITSQGCRDMRICVNDGTTFIVRLRQLFPEEYLVAKATGELALQGLARGDCQVVAGGVHDVSAGSVRDGGYSGAYESGVKRFSKDPLALVTRQDDPQWTSFVFWVVSATFYAEEEGINKESAEQMPITNLFGVLQGRFLRDAIEAVGSYGQIYSLHVAKSVARSGLNLLNSNPFGPQHYPFPGL